MNRHVDRNRGIVGDRNIRCGKRCSTVRVDCVIYAYRMSDRDEIINMVMCNARDISSIVNSGNMHIEAVACRFRERIAKCSSGNRTAWHGI